MNDAADLPHHGFRKCPWKKSPQTLEKGGKGAPAPEAPTQPPQTAKAPSASVYRERAQQAGQGGMSAGYQSTLLTGVGGVKNDQVAGMASLAKSGVAANKDLGM